MMHPAVSCVCLTFGRPKALLEEAIESFLRQSHPGPKELVILNDFAAQELSFSHPEVTIINLARRFRTLGEKRNAAVALARYEWICVWDDDDLYLPHRLSFSFARLEPARRFFKASKAWTLNDGKLGGPVSNLFHAGSLWHRSLFDEVGGYGHRGSGEDLDLELRFESVIGSGKNLDAIEPAELYYIYRWSGTRSYHLSGHGAEERGALGYRRVGEFAEEQVRLGLLPTGRIELAPHWATDYEALVRAKLTS